jgi:hypothetical protein
MRPWNRRSSMLPSTTNRSVNPILALNCARIKEKSKKLIY